MCGIVGVIRGKGSRNDDKDYNGFFQDALIAGAVRGSDSTGIFQIEEPPKGKELCYVHKSTDSGITFVNDKWAQGIIQDAMKCFVTIGHNRQATNGAIHDDNAHPFLHQRADGTYFIGVHNGTLTSYSKEEDGNKFSVDSDWAVYKLSKGIKENIKQIYGAYAFALYDSSTPDKFYIASNGQRPLHFAFVTAQNSMLIASEPEMLAWIAKRNRFTIDKDTIFSVPADVILTFDYDDLRNYAKETITRSYSGPSSPYKDDDDVPWHGVMGPYHNSASFVRDKIKEIVNKVRRSNGNVPVKDGVVNIQGTVTPPVVAPATPATLLSTKTGVTAEEFKELTTTLGIPYGTEGLFKPTAGWDELTKTVLGEVVLVAQNNDVEYFEAGIRGVDKAQWEKIKADNAKDFNVRAIGAFMHTRLGDKGLETQIICRIPIKEVEKAKPAASAKSM